MRSFHVAHLRIRGNDLIILPLSESFARMPPQEREAALREVRAAAKSAGLKGTVVPVWPFGEQIQFLAPKPWHPFFRGVSWSWLQANLNRQIVV